MSDVSLDARPPVVPGTDPKKSGVSDVGRPSFRTIPSILREYESLPRTFENSRWFTRGWTLQELIAPPVVEFYAGNWEEIGTKFSLRRSIGKITGIDIRVLEGADPSTCTVAERMSWAASRQTTRVEDAAYCLLGIFKVHMPLIYGEGTRAFYRLQKEIMKTTEDYTMLAWGLSKYLSSKHHWKIQGNDLTDRRQPLAESPNDFELHNRSAWTYSALIQHLHDPTTTPNSNSSNKNPSNKELLFSHDDTPPLITSRGLRVTLLVRHMPKSSDVYAYINCRTIRPGAPPDAPPSPVCLILRQQPGSPNMYTGSDNPNASFVLLDSERDLALFQRKTIYLSGATPEGELNPSNGNRLNTHERHLYLLDKDKTRLGAGTTIMPWKITSCFSHAVGAGSGHTHFEVPRKFTPATLFHPFDLPPSTVRLFAFEQPLIQISTPSQTQGQGQGQGGDAFVIVVGHGWCNVLGLRDVEFRTRWGVLVRDGRWDDGLALKFICHVAQHPRDMLVVGEELADRVQRRVGGLVVSVALKKVRRGDINCESAVKIVWSVST